MIPANRTVCAACTRASYEATTPHIRQTKSLRLRTFSSSSYRYAQPQKQSFNQRLRHAWNGTPIKWKPIPIGLGIAFLGGLQFYRVQARENARQAEEDKRSAEEGGSDRDSEGRPKKRKRIRPSGPWYVSVCKSSRSRF